MEVTTEGAQKLAWNRRKKLALSDKLYQLIYFLRSTEFHSSKIRMINSPYGVF